MLVLEEIVHLLFGKIGTGDLVSVRGGRLAETAPSDEHHALKSVCVRVGLTLYVIDRIPVFHIGIEAEDHLARCNLDEKLVKTFALSAICTASYVDNKRCKKYYRMFRTLIRAQVYTAPICRTTISPVICRCCSRCSWRLDSPGAWSYFPSFSESTNSANRRCRPTSAVWSRSGTPVNATR